MTDLPKEVADAQSLVRHIQQGHDRVTLRLDSSDPDVLPIDTIDALCGGRARLIPQLLGFHPVWKMKLQMPQPTRKALKVVRDSLGNEHNVLITKVEVTTDFISRSAREASQFETFLLEHLVVPYRRHEVRLEEEFGTVYHFAPRYAAPESSDAGSDPQEDGDRDPAGETQRVRSKNFGLYADRKSKLPGPWSGRACAHFESRLLRVEGEQGGWHRQHERPADVRSCSVLGAHDHSEAIRDTVEFGALGNGTGYDAFLTCSHSPCPRSTRRLAKARSDWRSQRKDWHLQLRLRRAKRGFARHS